MGSLLRLRIKSFFSDIAFITILNIIFYFVLIKLHIISKPESYEKVRNWVMQGYYLLCFIYVPAKTIGMKIFKLSYIPIGDEREVGLWDVVKFYFFQTMFLLPLFVSFLILIQKGQDGILFVLLGIAISSLDFLPLFINKDYLFLHDKLSNIKIDRTN